MVRIYLVVLGAVEEKEEKLADMVCTSVEDVSEK